MGVLAGKEWAFDTAASKYERMRPGYVDDLYKQIFDYCTIDNRSELIEVGIGGVFARFANHPFRCKNEPELASAIDASYEKYYYKFYNKKAEQIKEYFEEDAKERAYLAEKYGFSDIQYSLFYRIREFTAEEYVELLGTYSDHIAIDEDARTLFFKDIEDIINSMGGVIKIYDTMDFQLAKKVSG